MVESGYSGQCISWTATDLHPATYTIELQGSGIVAGPTAWISGGTFLNYIPDGFAVGVYVYTVTFTDDYMHTTTDIVTFTVEAADITPSDDDGGGIPGVRSEIISLISIGTVAAIVMVKKKKYLSNVA